MTGSVEISLTQLVLGIAPVLAAFAISYFNQLGLGKALTVGVFRSTIQLSITGYILLWVFALQDWWLIGAILIFMVGAAAQAASKRLKTDLKMKRRMMGLLFFSVFCGSMLSLFYVQFVVVRPDPVWDGRYMIPLAGMVISNAMNAAALAAERFRSELVSRAGEIETWLSLGASAKQSCSQALRVAMAAAMMPSINSLAVLGVVSLPGMMSGQILAGASPLLAVRYQLIVVFMICCASSITSWLTIEMTMRLYFTKEDQFLRPQS